MAAILKRLAERMTRDGREVPICSTANPAATLASWAAVHGLAPAAKAKPSVASRRGSSYRL